MLKRRRKQKQQAKPNEINYGNFNVGSSGSMESLETRLASMLTEADEKSITFSRPEVERIILTIIARVSKENHEGLVARVKDMKSSSTGGQSGGQSGASQSASLDNNEISRLQSRLDTFEEDLKDKIRRRKDIDDKVKADLGRDIQDLIYDLTNEIF